MGFANEVQQAMNDAVNNDPIVLQLWCGAGSLEIESKELVRILAVSQKGLNAGITAIANKMDQLI